MPRSASLGRIAAAAAIAVLLQACSGGGSSPSTPPTTNPGPPPTPAPTAPPSPGIDTSTTYDASSGMVNGTTGSLGVNNQGAPSSATIDGVQCNVTSDAATFEPGHLHSFVGVIANGIVYAFPAGIGMFKPAGIGATYTAGATVCLFNLHTHDQSGTLHTEYPGSSLLPPFSLGQFLAVWSASEGLSFTSDSIASFSGHVWAYTGTAVPRAGANPIVTSYTLFNGDYTTIPITSHLAVWLVLNAPPAKGLPQVEFGSTQ